MHPSTPSHEDAPGLARNHFDDYKLIRRRPKTVCPPPPPTRAFRRHRNNDVFTTEPSPSRSQRVCALSPLSFSRKRRGRSPRRRLARRRINCRDGDGGGGGAHTERKHAHERTAYTPTQAHGRVHKRKHARVYKSYRLRHRSRQVGRVKKTRAAAAAAAGRQTQPRRFIITRTSRCVQCARA